MLEPLGHSREGGQGVVQPVAPGGVGRWPFGAGGILPGDWQVGWEAQWWPGWWFDLWTEAKATRAPRLRGR